ncbi:MAG: hypothetical protein N2203_02550 [Bacteroidia bacterium]|nr:hypothetical protein [Bacteroidia bacterium]
MRILVYLLGMLMLHDAIAQKKNINAAWRALTDYQSTLNDKPNLQYLIKAKENIDVAIQNPETKEDAKALTYHSQIYFELFKYYQNNPDINTNPYVYLNTAIQSYRTLQDKHPKVAGTPEIQNHAILLLNTSSKEAVQLFNEKKYHEASQLFYDYYDLRKKIFNTADTSYLFNAFVSAYKAESEKIKTYAEELKKINGDNPKLYQMLYYYYQNKKDSTHALKTLQEGRNKFFNDHALLNLETDYYITHKQYQHAIKNLEQLIQRDSTNALLLLTLGNIYDNMANQRMNQKNYSDTTDQFFQKTIQSYLQSYRHKDKLDQENLFTLAYNLGAYYTNYGLFYYNKKMKELKITDLSQKQKEVENKRKEYTQMSLPYLKEAESIKPNDNTVITALYRVYALIGDSKNAELYKNKMLGK